VRLGFGDQRADRADLAGGPAHVARVHARDLGELGQGPLELGQVLLARVAQAPEERLDPPRRRFSGEILAQVLKEAVLLLGELAAPERQLQVSDPDRSNRAVQLVSGQHRRQRDPAKGDDEDREPDDDARGQRSRKTHGRR
jgi:hypothetical protein